MTREGLPQARQQSLLCEPAQPWTLTPTLTSQASNYPDLPPDPNPTKVSCWCLSEQWQ